MLRSFNVLIFLSYFWLLVEGNPVTDYCSPKLCSAGRLHIACNNSRSFSAACPRGQTEIVTMTEELKKAILHNHNSKRQVLACGDLGGFKSAAKMVSMQWDDELAEMAELNVKTCKFQHDYCHNTFKFKPSGQNLAKMWWKGGSYSDKEIILTRIDNWWLEYKITNMSQLQAYPRYTDKMIGHFTVMTDEENSFLGCAVIKFPENGMSSLTMACNYAATNLIGMPMYTVGPAASKCVNGKSTEYSCLCA